MSDRESDYDSLISDLYDGVIDDDAWDRALTGLARLVGGEGPLLISVNPGTHELHRFACYSYSPAVVSEYNEFWLAHDIRVAASLHLPLLEPFTEAQSVGAQAWTRSAIFNEFLYRNDCPWTIHAELHRSNEKATSVSIQALRSRGPFGPEDVQTLRPLMAHLRRALELKDRLEMTNLRRVSLANGLDRATFGVLVLDRDGRIMEANACAEEMIRKCAGVGKNPDGTVWLNEPAGGQLNLWLSRGRPTADSADGLLHVPRGARESLAIILTRLPEFQAPWIGSQPPSWLILLFDPEQRQQADAQIIEQDLRTSEREAQIAALLTSGLELSQIAQRLHISVHTARTHLKSIFSKTGISSQAELVGRIATGPATVRKPRRNS